MTMPPEFPIVDLQVGFPFTTIEEKKATYDFFRPLLKDTQSARDFEFPAEYMFKGVPDLVDPGTDVIEWTVEQMDRYGIAVGLTGLSPRSLEARERHPGRFVLQLSVNPHEGVEVLRKMKRAKDTHDIVSVMCFPAGQVPQVPIDDKKMYPIYAKCVELDVPMCVNVGVPGPRVPMACQRVDLVDEVCYDFPDLTLVMMHGAEPWTALAVKLMLKWPGLHYMTSAFAPKHYPKDIIEFANTRGADKIMYCGYPSGLTYERIFQDLPNVPFKPDVWPKFLGDNARRVFGIDAALDLRP